MSFAALNFAAPWVLSAFLLLPLLWWFLKLTPPAPVQVVFPPLGLLMSLKTVQESSESAPWWLILLRLLLISSLILAASGPSYNSVTLLTGKGPLYIIIDNGWSSAFGWQKRLDMATTLLSEARLENRPAVIVTTARDKINAPWPPPQLISANAALEKVQNLTPLPWRTERKAAIAPLLDHPALKKLRPGDVFWLSDGLEENPPRPDARPTTVKDLLTPLRSLGATTLVGQARAAPAILRVPERRAGGVAVKIVRARTNTAQTLRLNIYDDKGLLLDQKPALFKQGSRTARVKLSLPTELLNRTGRMQLDGQSHAGAIVLLDRRWRRPVAGLLQTDTAAQPQSLLNANYYLKKALLPSTDLISGSLQKLFTGNAGVIVLNDPPPLKTAENKALLQWIDQGGVLLRFAGPKLAARTLSSSISKPERALLPVKLSPGTRTLGGAMSWGKPQKLAEFPPSSPFKGLPVKAEVIIKRQVLARPSPGAFDEGQIWARLDDGTPLISATPKGDGLSILVHTTANTEWNNLALSGLFQSMLERIMVLANGNVKTANDAPLVPDRVMDGFAALKSPGADVLPILPENIDRAMATPGQPPGFYGTINQQTAFNLTSVQTTVRPVLSVPPGVRHMAYQNLNVIDWTGILLIITFILGVVDWLISLWSRGMLRNPTKPLAAMAVLSVFLVPRPALAVDDSQAIAASGQTTLAYVITGDQTVDDISQRGLTGLGAILTARTAIEPGPPQGVRPGRDELAFYPLLYWPLTDYSGVVSDQAATAVQTYLNHGGTILFDTRSGPAGAANNGLLTLSKQLNLPPLIPVPADYVLGRSFYLLNDFPGRWAGGTLWIENADDTTNDGVTRILSGNADWARAWARGPDNQPIYPVIPGGERQREMAYRFGVNLVMMTLTGSYKADQVHLKEILKRLGP